MPWTPLKAELQQAVGKFDPPPVALSCYKLAAAIEWSSEFGDTPCLVE